ncbi:MAG: hydrogenase iron-sulfur subunit [Desulfomonile tiedjei]|nr:hydrogenase iron-sulfur subunit [Desulfomonile tiedjei]
MMNHAIGDEANPKDCARLPRVLVVGSGMAAEVAARSMAEMGIDVTFARVRGAQPNVCFAHPGTTMEEASQFMQHDPQGVEVLDVDSAPVVNRALGGFRAVFEDHADALFDCLFLAPGISLKPVPAMLPESTELFSARTVVGTNERVAFLLDFLEPSDAANGMAAIELAVQNVLNGGSSAVCFRNVPVMHLFGETIYQGARKAGVQFVRFGDQLPHVVFSTGAEGPARFRVSVVDVIDEENEWAWDCDRVISVTGPDPSSIPKWAVEMAKGELDSGGFLLADSVHCASGSSFGSGVFLVGEATGSLDMLGCVATARAAAAKAVAGIRRSSLETEDQAVSVSTACARCLTCYRICPHEALLLGTESSQGRVQPWLPFCRKCGICESVCPTMAIRLKDSPEESLISTMRSSSPSEIGETTFVFGCRRSAGVIAESAQLPKDVRFQAVPCAGNVSEYMIWSTLAAGAKAVLLVGCHNGNCASRTGTHWAAARVQRGVASGILGQETPRIGYLTVAANEPARFQRLLGEFIDRCAAAGNGRIGHTGDYHD